MQIGRSFHQLKKRAEIIVCAHKTQGRPLAHQFECGLQLGATAEEAGPGQHIEPQPSSRHRHYQSTHIPQMADVLGTHQGEDDIVILLPLVAVHRGHLRANKKGSLNCTHSPTL